MFTDYHSHILPAIDDGAINTKMSVGIIKTLQSQGVSNIVLTPHFYNHRSAGIDDYSKKRAYAFEALNLELKQANLENEVQFLIGSEVYIEHQLSAEENVKSLAIEKTNKIMLEFPYQPFKNWMIEEVYNICYSHGLKPIIAHVERYLEYYNSANFSEICNIDDAIFQINAVSLKEKKYVKFILEMINDGYPVVLGSDSHDVNERALAVGFGYSLLKSKLSKAKFQQLLNFAKNLLPF